MKRILASALSAALLMGALAGCGGNTGSGSVSGSNASAGGSSSGENVIKIGVFEPRRLRLRRQEGDAGHAVCQLPDPHGGSGRH